ncbi:hypothetical protein [Terrarubrum flagellatum]|uniref:hypothetical protein n=1 Tax=Terrirubrum flagellatum TaxID=2895980 RepID=UPI003144EAF7
MRAAFALAVCFVASSSPEAFARQCQFETHSICNGCAVESPVKMKRMEKSAINRWCGLDYSSALNYYTGIRIVKGFALGELRAGRYSVRMSPLRTGHDTVVIELRGRSGRTGEPFASRVTFNVDVVENDF